MKTLTAKQEIERQKTGQDIFWLLEIDFPPPTGTKYYSTRQLTIEGRTYQGKIVRYPLLSKVLALGIDESGIADEAEIGIQSLPQDPDRFEKLMLQHTLEGLIVRLRYVFRDQPGSVGLSDVIDAHTYKIDDCQVTTHEVILKLVDLVLAAGEREIGRTITPQHFPLAPPESFSRIMPIIFGRCRDCRLIPVDIGQQTGLYGSLSPDDVVIKVEDVSNFSDPRGAWLKIQIDDEIVYYNYLNRTTNEFGSGSSPCKRGQDDTVAREHSDGATVREIKSFYHYLVAGHRCKVIDNVRIAGRPIANWSAYIARIAEKDVQLLKIIGLPLYEDVMPLSSILQISGDKDKKGLPLWNWAVGANNTAVDSQNAFDAEGIFQFACIDKDNPQLHIKMLDSLADGDSKYGKLIDARLAIEYYESQPHDLANPPYIMLKRNGSFQLIDYNLHHHVMLKRSEPEETEADNPDHQHENDFALSREPISNYYNPPTETAYRGGFEGWISGLTYVRYWPTPENALFGSTSFCINFKGQFTIYLGGGIYAARDVANSMLPLWFKIADLHYNDTNSRLKRVKVKLLAGGDPISSFTHQWVRICTRPAGSKLVGPNSIEAGTFPNIEGRGMSRCYKINALKEPSWDYYHESTEDELREARQQFEWDITDRLNIRSWADLQKHEFGVNLGYNESFLVSEFHFQDWWPYNPLYSIGIRVYEIKLEIEHEPISQLQLSGQVLLADRELMGKISSNRATQYVNLTACVEANGAWAFFNGTIELHVFFNSTSSDVKIYILNVSFELEYRARTKKIGTGDVTADVEGEHSGAILYENPAEIIWRLFSHADYMSLSADYLDAGSFVAAKTELTARGYKFARRIAERIQLRELLAEAVWQSRCRLYFEGGKYRLKFRPLGPAGLYSPGASVFTFDKTNILEPILNKMRSHTLQLANQITVNYDEDNNGDEFLQSYQASEPSSIDRPWGLRPLTLNARWHAHKNSTVIADLVAFLLQLSCQKHTLVAVDTPLLCAHLERGDTVTINHPESELNNIPGEIITTSRIAPHRLQFLIDTVAAHVYAYWYDSCNYVLISPGRTVMYFVVECELLGTLDWKGNLRLRGSLEQHQKYKAVSFEDPVRYIPPWQGPPHPPPDPDFQYVLTFVLKTAANQGWAIAWFHGKTWSQPYRRRLTVASKVKTNHPLTATATGYITNSQQEWIRFAVDGVNVVAEYNHTDKTFYLKGGIQTNVIL